MKKIILSMAIIVIVGAVTIGITTAYFSDAETSTGNTFTAGTLDLNLDGANTNVVKFSVSDVKPGDSGSGTWTINNAGSIDGYLDLENISVVNNDNGCNDPESDVDATCTATGGGELGANMNVDLFIDENNNGVKDTGETTIYNGVLDNIAVSYDQNLALTAGSTNYVTLNWNVPTDVGNVIQSDSLTLGMTFELAQTAGQ